MLMTIRYDTECGTDEIAGFLMKAVQVHKADNIPATFFCTGSAIELREAAFREFMAAIDGDPLFDIQDHSYSHIGVCYEAGKAVEALREDYNRSFDTHRRIIGKSPVGVSLCGTSGKDGDPLPGFDATPKSRQEFEMLADLGVRMVNTRLINVDGTREFCNYSCLGRPDIMGFISGYADVGWFFRKDYDEAMDYITAEIRKRSEAGEHIPILLHDWCAWHCAPDKSLDHVRRIAETGRKCGYELRTHLQCYEDKALWQDESSE